MSAATCIPDLVANGTLTGKKAEEAMKMYRRHEGRFIREMSPEAAAVAASQAVVEEMERVAAAKERRTVMTHQARQRMRQDMETYGGDPVRAAEALLAADAKAPYMNVEAQAAAIRGRAQAMVEGVLKKHRRNLLGNAKDQAGLDDLTRERFGEATGNASAKELADAFGDAAEYLRQRANRAGFDIGTRADWGLPQAHDGMKLRQHGYEQWREDQLAWLALNRMVDADTGRAFTPDALEDALRESYATIASDGWNKREAGAHDGGGGAIGQRAKHRFFAYKDADSWLAYQAKYGQGNAFTAMVGHIEAMSREIALAERLGPNPEAAVDWLKDMVKKQAFTDLEGGRTDLDAARGAAKRIENLFDTVSGNLNSPVNERWARRFGGVRSFLTSALLGSASISAVTDVGFQGLTRAFNGLPVTRALWGYVKLLNPANAADRRLAVRLGLQAEDAARSMAALGRFIDQSQGPEVAARLSDLVLRVSGLNVWTQVGRWDFGMSVLGHIADQRDTAWGELNSSFRAMLERYGIGEGDWADIGHAALHKERGGEWLDPAALDEQLGDKVLRMIATETDFAVPSATARARSTLSFGQRPGTLGGELLRNAVLFKSFGVSMLMTHGARMASARTAGGKLGYFIGLTVTTTLLGALAVQLKEIAKGRDALDMGTGSFWAKSALMGGGYGIFGDFVDSMNRADQFGGGPAETLAGPVVGAAVDAFKTGKHALVDAAKAAGMVEDDGKRKAGRDVVRDLKRYMPGGSLWYLRLAYERGMLDWLQSEIDPDYAQSWDRLDQRVGHDTGQGIWWRPGESRPDRAPELSQQPQ